MKHRFIPALLAPVLLLASCGGGASYTDVADAMQQAERARASKDTGAAESAYGYVLENSDAAAELLTALMGLYAVQVSSDPAAALATYDRLAADHTDALTAAVRMKLVDQAIDARAVEAGNQILDAALAAFPDQKESFLETARRRISDDVGTDEPLR